ncbi:MAG: SRPBCC family protein [Bacteroidia bacterium]|nr:SRPBCC family protein [Bacteroidia bacterium]NND09661.1 SRPBCC family protein [Flavobacteriaceae bacterium]MBT8310484.1 SRPBCC family protein [Bacteroidia bacterium]NNK28755.1 SRPBCC family protein [Flavobacteriaceae bacterium]NNL60867.1 SRPBCC family protein [Flavobacteriaceae bacterium]
MKYSTEITLDLPREDVIKKLDNVDNMKHWQRGLVSAEHLEGIPGKVGAKMRLRYKMGKRDMELIETITKQDFPKEFHAYYDTPGVHNIQENYFEELPNGQTKWTSHSEFQFSSFMMKLMGFLMPGMFKKQSKKYLNDFKAFAEKGTSVADAKD